MRFFVTGPINYGYSRSVIRAIEAAKHEAEFYPMREFYVQASYWQRKLYSWDVHRFAKIMIGSGSLRF